MTGRLETCPACVERRVHTDEEWAVHSLLQEDVLRRDRDAEVDARAKVPE